MNKSELKEKCLVTLERCDTCRHRSLTGIACDHVLGVSLGPDRSYCSQRYVAFQASIGTGDWQLRDPRHRADQFEAEAERRKLGDSHCAYYDRATVAKATSNTASCTATLRPTTTNVTFAEPEP